MRRAFTIQLADGKTDTQRLTAKMRATQLADEMRAGLLLPGPTTPPPQKVKPICPVCTAVSTAKRTVYLENRHGRLRQPRQVILWQCDEHGWYEGKKAT